MFDVLFVRLHMFGYVHVHMRAVQRFTDCAHVFFDFIDRSEFS